MLHLEGEISVAICVFLSSLKMTSIPRKQDSPSFTVVDSRATQSTRQLHVLRLNCDAFSMNCAQVGVLKHGDEKRLVLTIATIFVSSLHSDLITTLLWMIFPLSILNHRFYPTKLTHLIISCRRKILA